MYNVPPKYYLFIRTTGSFFFGGRRIEAGFFVQECQLKFNIPSVLKHVLPFKISRRDLKNQNDFNHTTIAISTREINWADIESGLFYLFTVFLCCSSLQWMLKISTNCLRISPFILRNLHFWTAKLQRWMDDTKGFLEKECGWEVVMVQLEYQIAFSVARGTI